MVSLSCQHAVTHQMPKRYVEVWHNILKQAVDNLSSPKHRPLSSSEGIHSDLTCTINVYRWHHGSKYLYASDFWTYFFYFYRHKGSLRPETWWPTIIILLLWYEYHEWFGILKHSASLILTIHSQLLCLPVSMLKACTGAEICRAFAISVIFWPSRMMVAAHQ